MITLEQIANWNSQQNPLEKVLGQNSISPCVTARGAGEDHSGMILYCDELKETTNLRNNYMIEHFNNKALNETLSTNQVESGDFIDAYNRVVKKDIAGTIKTTVNTSNMTFVADGKTMNFKPSDVCGTLLTNSNFTGCGVQLIKEDIQHDTNLKQQMCDQLLTEGKVKEFDVIRHNYSNARMQDGRTQNKDTNLSPTLDTRCDCLGVCVKDEPNIKRTYRIRKLTPKECGRLMGVKDEDIDKMSVNQSNSKLYHLYGDSIVVDVLMEIFGQMI